MWTTVRSALTPGSLSVFQECGNGALACVLQWAVKQRQRERLVQIGLEMKGGVFSFPKCACVPEGLQLPLPCWLFFFSSQFPSVIS